MAILLYYVISLIFFAASILPLLFRLGNQKEEVILFDSPVVHQSDDPNHLSNNEIVKVHTSTKTTWIGDAWILSFQLYSPFEIRSHFYNHNVLIIGDAEVSRIHYGTLIQLLMDNTTSHPSKYQLGNSTLLDHTYIADGSTCSNKSILNRQGICRNFSQHHHIDFVQLECFHQVSTLFRQEGYQLQQNYDIIIIGTDRLETAVPFQRRRCEKTNDVVSTNKSLEFPDDAIQRMEELFEILFEYQMNSSIVWRNGAFSREKQHRFVEEMDHHVKKKIENESKNIILLDYANGIKERIYTRLPPLERALIFLQLLMNSLVKGNI